MIDKFPVTIGEICRKIQKTGGRAYLVGGCVRDLLLDLQPKDFDLEVYGIGMDQLHQQLVSLGRTETVGKSFGVIKLWLDSLEIDVALPRCERKTSRGHRGFEVDFDPAMSPEEASSRRDFTINAMMLDPLDGKLFDFHGGRQDLERGILRHVSSAFSEDPLRVLRGMQFASRFRLHLHVGTALLCRTLKQDADSLAIERIWIEWRKWAEGEFPSYGLKVLEESRWVSLYPELATMIGCPQEPKWHPEGDVWHHILQVVDRASKIAKRYSWSRERRYSLVFVALLHDLGKPETTITDQKGRIRSPDHSIRGLKHSASFLGRIGAPASLLSYIQPLIKDHLTHMHGAPSDRAVRRLAARLVPSDIELWEALVEADASGRSPLPACRPALAWLEKAHSMQHHQSKPVPIVTGKLLMEYGIEPGPEMGKIIREAYEAQLDGIIGNREEGRQWCIRHRYPQPDPASD